MKHVLVLAVVVLFAPTIACAKDACGAWKFEAPGARGRTSTMTCTLSRSGNSAVMPSKASGGDRHVS